MKHAQQRRQSSLYEASVKSTEVLSKFNVPSQDGSAVLATVVEHHVELPSGYELITITQTNDDGTIDCVCMHRHQLAALANMAKGH